MQTEIMKIGGLQGAACASKIDAALGAVTGVRSVSTSMDTHKATVTFDPELVSKQRLTVAIADAGYEYIKSAHGEDGNCCGGCGG
ncbi:heavy-metal-associated domain-containing protein [Alcaligenaceae bacterium CGII-47]|nr:heavy-metal-associated domain-containing protein [Alcaligenaceae bacterium CGII-47]